MELILRGGTVYIDGALRRVDVSVSGGVVSSVGSLLHLSDPSAETVDCSGKYIFPGFSDVHVHLREPGFLYKETIATGTAAAAHGGYTSVCAMPNLDPPPDSAAHLAVQTAAIERDALINVYPYGRITNPDGTLADIDALAPDVVAFSDDGRGVQDGQTMCEAMIKVKSLGKIIAAHCEDESLLHGGIIHDGEYARAHNLPGISSESEWRQIERDISLVRETGCRYHVCHVSTAESVALIRGAKSEGLPVTAETAPHYLLLDERDLRDDGAFKMNPPLRSPADREALIEGILDDTIDMIATDHAPHSEEEKSRGLRSANGIVGLETAFPALYTGLVTKKIISLEKLVSLLTDAPRKVFGVGSTIEYGMSADITVFDLENEYLIDPASFLSKGRSTPFAGQTVRGRCLLTLCGGRKAWEYKHGK